MLPDELRLLLERFRHGLAVELESIESADDEQSRTGAYLHRVSVGAIGWKNAGWIVLDDGHIDDLSNMRKALKLIAIFKREAERIQFLSSVTPTAAAPNLGGH